jgi:hypothetical protein
VNPNSEVDTNFGICKTSWDGKRGHYRAFRIVIKKIIDIGYHTKTMGINLHQIKRAIDEVVNSLN